MVDRPQQFCPFAPADRAARCPSCCKRYQASLPPCASAWLRVRLLEPRPALVPRGQRKAAA
jgi:hypothetical protein